MPGLSACHTNLRMRRDQERESPDLMPIADICLTRCPRTLRICPIVGLQLRLPCSHGPHDECKDHLSAKGSGGL